jgi:hypothetical protein
LGKTKESPPPDLLGLRFSSSPEDSQEIRSDENRRLGDQEFLDEKREPSGFSVGINEASAAE